MEVIKISPGGSCYRVVDAFQVVQQAIKDPHIPRPVHIFGQIIHNRHAASIKEQYPHAQVHTVQTETLVPMRKGDDEGAR